MQTHNIPDCATTWPSQLPNNVSNTRTITLCCRRHDIVRLFCKTALFITFSPLSFSLLVDKQLYTNAHLHGTGITAQHNDTTATTTETFNSCDVFEMPPNPVGTEQRADRNNSCNSQMHSGESARV